MSRTPRGYGLDAVDRAGLATEGTDNEPSGTFLRRSAAMASRARVRWSRAAGHCNHVVEVEHKLAGLRFPALVGESDEVLTKRKPPYGRGESRFWLTM